MVTLDGKLLDEAAISFVPLAAGRKKTGGLIRNGRYQLPPADGLLPGRYRVEILDSPPLHLTPRQQQLRRKFPYRYTNDSPLMIEVPAGQPGPIQFDFELTGGP
ncbi:MAG: hypothetical protein JNG90_16380 [Planctomycetaceae bacterium]|nr:hypothetical protein [Planctomycetaceae bacterium]